MAIGVCKKLDEYCVVDMGEGVEGRMRGEGRENGREGEGAEGRRKDVGGRESSIVHPASIVLYYNRLSSREYGILTECFP